MNNATLRTLINYLRSRAWALGVEHGIIRVNDLTILSEIIGKQPWEEFWQQFLKTFPSRFFYSPRNVKDFFIQSLQSLQPYEEILDDANDAAAHTFDLLGSGPVTLNMPIDWREDFKSGATWSNTFYTRLTFAQPADHADIKIPWELGRFHFLVWLGKGYWVSRSRKYSAAFVEYIDSWIAANPFCYGVQWGNAMEVAIRGCNWIAGAAFFLEEPSIPPEFWQRFIIALWKHAVYIEHNLEITRRSGNHLIADYAGLVFIGNIFSNTTQGKMWRQRGVRGIEEEIMRQTSDDGVNYEKSLSYHRFVAEMCMDVMLLCKLSAIPFSNKAAERIEKMCEFAMQYSRPDHSVPAIGDADDGRLFRFRAKENFNDHSALLSTATIAFSRGDLKAAAGNFSEDSLWLCGTAGLEKYRALASPHKPASNDFPKGGFYILRSTNVHCIIDAGELGKHGWGGHGHNDTFSFEYWYGEPFIIDSGTFCYLSDPKRRRQFRSTAAHNTIMVDTTELADFTGPFKIKEDPTRPIILSRSSSEHKEIIEMEHFAYARLNEPVTHRRAFTFDKTSERLTITDTLSGNGTHDIDLFLHFAPYIQVEVIDKSTLCVSGKKTALLITTPHIWQVSPCEISESYGTLTPSTKASVHISGELPVIIETSIVPAP